MSFLEVWGTVCGIIYTAAWSISFYGQVYENWKYKSYLTIHSACKDSP